MLWSITFYNDCAVDRTYIFFRWFSFHLQFFLFRLQFWNRLSCWFHLPSWRFSLSTSPTTSYTSFKSQIKLITSWGFEIKDFAEREKLSHFWTGDHIQCGSLTAYANNIYSMNLKWLRWERKKVLKSVPERLMKPDFVDANFFRLGFCPASAIIANQTFYYRLQQ